MSAERHEIDLKPDAHVAHILISVKAVDVVVAFWVSQKRIIAFCFDSIQRLKEVHGGVEVGGLDEEHVAFGAYGQEVAGFEAVHEEAVHHVFGGEVEFDVSLVGRLKLGKPLAQEVGGIGDVFHDVGCEPGFGDAVGFIAMEYRQGFFQGLHSVVNSGQDVAMPVGHARQLQRPASAEYFGEY